MPWHPIETAPKQIVRDYGGVKCGTDILIYSNGSSMAEMHPMRVGYWYYSLGSGRGMWVTATNGHRIVNPVAWQPLPASPKKKYCLLGPGECDPICSLWKNCEHKKLMESMETTL